MGLETFLGRTDAPDRSLVVVNRSAPRPIQTLLENAFESQPVTVEERDLPDTGDDHVLLVDDTGAGHEVIATSPLAALERTVLMVNSDLYRTGTTGLAEFELPDVLERLDGVPFQLRGYPGSNKEKLLLIVVSRSFERRAWRAGSGTLRSSFQRLSRINDERGTRAVYEKLAETALDTDVYGVLDWEPPVEFDVTAHTGYGDDFRDAWFVVYTPSSVTSIPSWSASRGTPPVRPWRCSPSRSNPGSGGGSGRSAPRSSPTWTTTSHTRCERRDDGRRERFYPGPR